MRSLTTTSEKQSFTFLQFKEPLLNTLCKTIEEDIGNDNKKDTIFNRLDCSGFPELAQKVLIWLENEGLDEKKNFLSTLTEYSIEKNVFNKSKRAFIILNSLLEPTKGGNKVQKEELLKLVDEILLKDNEIQFHRSIKCPFPIALKVFELSSEDKQKVLLELFLEDVKKVSFLNKDVVRLFTECFVKNLDDSCIVQKCKEVSQFKSNFFIQEFVKNVQKNEDWAKLEAFRTLLKKSKG